MVNLNRIKRKLKVNKEGIIAGAIVGFAMALYIKGKGAAVLLAMELPGMIDSVITSIPPEQMAFYKLALSLMFLGAMLGYLIDDMVMPRK